MAEPPETKREREREKKSTGWDEDPNRREWARQAVGLPDFSSSWDWARHGKQWGFKSEAKELVDLFSLFYM
jgi:hypothetical protein|uniref:Uncharacterized protein n=1 Tax=Fagus sylvatica TaxID=28930 RepID=A0A2N9F9S8_FAGSY